MLTPIKRAIFPVAGMGTRFLPATKANPKEMLPIVDKPLIQFAVEEAVEAGIKELIFVTSSSKRAIEDHFDTNFELEAKLIQQGRHELLSIVRGVLPKGVSCVYVRQPESLGLGHAVQCAFPQVNHEPFAVLLADDLIDNPGRGCLKQMVELYAETEQSVIAVEKIEKKECSKYGVIAIDHPELPVNLVNAIIEKPSPEDAPSNLGVVGRYILTPTIFSCLDQISKGANGEIQLTDAIALLLNHEKVYALTFEGQRYDCGSKLGYLQATLAYALKHPDVSSDFKICLNNLGTCTNKVT